MSSTETTIIRYSGHYEEHDGRWYAVCAELPLVGYGRSREEAYKDVGAGIRVFMEDLSARGELRMALDDGVIPSFRIDLGGSEPRIVGTTGTWQPVSDESDPWVLQERELTTA